jgi:hypothetical protein
MVTIGVVISEGKETSPKSPLSRDVVRMWCSFTAENYRNLGDIRVEYMLSTVVGGRAEIADRKDVVRGGSDWKEI